MKNTVYEREEHPLLKKFLEKITIIDHYTDKYCFHFATGNTNLGITWTSDQITREDAINIIKEQNNGLILKKESFYTVEGMKQGDKEPPMEVHYYIPYYNPDYVGGNNYTLCDRSVDYDIENTFWCFTIVNGNDTCLIPIRFQAGYKDYSIEKAMRMFLYEIQKQYDIICDIIHSFGDESEKTRKILKILNLFNDLCINYKLETSPNNKLNILINFYNEYGQRRKESYDLDTFSEMISEVKIVTKVTDEEE